MTSDHAPVEQLGARGRASPDQYAPAPAVGAREGFVSPMRARAVGDSPRRTLAGHFTRARTRAVGEDVRAPSAHVARARARSRGAASGAADPTPPRHVARAHAPAVGPERAPLETVRATHETPHARDARANVGGFPVPMRARATVGMGPASPPSSPPPPSSSSATIPDGEPLRPWRPRAGDVIEGTYLGQVHAEDFPPRRPDVVVRDGRGVLWRLAGGGGLGAAVVRAQLRPGDPVRVRRCPPFDVERTSPS